MSAMSASLPSGLANQMADALLGNNAPGWYTVTFQDAQKEQISGILPSESKKQMGMVMWLLSDRRVHRSRF